MTDFSELITKGKPAAPSKFIVMGDPMTGKTTLASKAPKPLFISTDGNAAKAGLHAVQATTLGVVRDAINYFSTAKEYETLVIDTVEGIADLFEKTVLDNYMQETGQTVTALTDVPYGKLTGQFNRRMAAFSETLWSVPKNVIVLTYTKRQIDDVSGSIVLASELKSIRQFTRFADGLILTSFDGDKYEARVVSKRTVMAGDVVYGSIEPFLKSANWALPSRKVKVGSGRKG
jgi:hypothetical protein